jgi:hypothetical protein
MQAQAMPPFFMLTKQFRLRHGGFRMDEERHGKTISTRNICIGPSPQSRLLWVRWSTGQRMRVTDRALAVHCDNDIDCLHA